MTYLPLFQVIVPLVSAPVCVVQRRARLIWLLAIIAGSLAFIISVMLLHHVTNTGVIIFSPGNWLASLGIEYRFDYLNAYLFPVITAVSTIILIPAFPGIQKELSAEHHELFFIYFILCLAGLLGVIASGDLISVIVFFEIAAFSSYMMTSLGNDRRALVAAYQYFLMGTVGALLILAGTGLMYMAAGTLHMHSLAQSMPGLVETPVTGIAAGLFIAGVCLKLGLFPLHLWLPGVYRYAPALVTAFLAATVVQVPVYLLIRLIYSVFGMEFSLFRLPLQNIFLALGFAGIIIASITAIYQQNVRNMLAYTTVAQIPYLLVGLSMGNATGLMGALLHLFSLVLINGTLFMVICAVIYRLGCTDLESFSGLGKRMPWTVSSIIVAGLSLIGVPLTAGFISKWYLVLAAVENGWFSVAVLILIGSLLSAVCIWRLIEVTCFRPGSTVAGNAGEAPLILLIPLWIMSLSSLYFGIDTRFTIGLSQLISQSLFGISP
jgi:multicomponent Na+:H+ antiporter subunit D